MDDGHILHHTLGFGQSSMSVPHRFRLRFPFRRGNHRGLTHMYGPRPPCFVYVLRLGNGGWYVGSTRNLAQRVAKHFSRGGAMATREIKPVAVEKIYLFEDQYFGVQPVRLWSEVFIASQYARRHGLHRVKGAKHGRGWDSGPTKNGLRFIRRDRAFFQTDEGKRWLESVVEVDPREHFPSPI